MPGECADTHCQGGLKGSLDADKPVVTRRIKLAALTITRPCIRMGSMQAEQDPSEEVSREQIKRSENPEKQRRSTYTDGKAPFS